MSGPFEHYPVTPGSIDDAGQEINAAANPMAKVALEAARASARASTHTEGFLDPLFGALGDPVVSKGAELRKAAAFAGAVTRSWSVAVSGYDRAIDDLNREYQAAKARGFDVAEPQLRGGQSPQARERMFDDHAADVKAAGDAKLAELRRRRDRLDDRLDETAGDLAGRLDRGPTDADWVAFKDIGVLPDAFDHYVPVGPRPTVPKGDGWFAKAFKTVVFDYSQFGKDGSFWGGAVEIAGIIPVGKVVKGAKLAKEGAEVAADGRKLSKAERAAEEAKDAQKTWDKADDARKAADAARRELDEMFAAGATPKASALRDYAERQGWTLRKNPNGPPIYVDENGVKRITIKRGTPRAPGSEHPHVEMRDSSGQRVDRDGAPTTNRDPGNHTPIDWDLD